MPVHYLLFFFSLNTLFRMRVIDRCSSELYLCSKMKALLSLTPGERAKSNIVQVLCRPRQRGPESTADRSQEPPISGYVDEYLPEDGPKLNKR